MFFRSIPTISKPIGSSRFTGPTTPATLRCPYRAMLARESLPCCRGTPGSTCYTTTSTAARTSILSYGVSKSPSTASHGGNRVKYAIGAIISLSRSENSSPASADRDGITTDRDCVIISVIGAIAARCATSGIGISTRTTTRYNQIPDISAAARDLERPARRKGVNLVITVRRDRPAGGDDIRYRSRISSCQRLLNPAQVSPVPLITHRVLVTLTAVAMPVVAKVLDPVLVPPASVIVSVVIAMVTVFFSLMNVSAVPTG